MKKKLQTVFAPMDPARTQVWSCGGGTQSAAIAALIIQGRLPKPDIAVMVDTGREKSATWRYAEAVLIPELRKVGIELEIIAKEKYATVDLWSGEDGRLPVLPVFTTENTAETGKVGKLTNYCSGEWKREVTARYLRRDRGVQQIENWIGYSFDERRRISAPRSLWNRPRYPLIQDVPMRRNGCIIVVTEEMGWPQPPRSACWNCPNQSNAEWAKMRNEDPEDFAQAVALDHLLRETDPHAYLHESAVPLDQADFSEPSEAPNLFGCDSGLCFV